MRPELAQCLGIETVRIAPVEARRVLAADTGHRAVKRVTGVPRAGSVGLDRARPG